MTMARREGIRLALLQIRVQKLKSFFAVLGVIIGVTFLIIVISVVEGLDRYIQEDFAGRVYGLNTLTIRRSPSAQISVTPEQRREWQRRPRLTAEDAEAIAAQLRVPALVAVHSMGGGGRVEAADATPVQNVWLSAVSADYFRVRELEVARGRLISPVEDGAGTRVAVLGHETAELLFGLLDPVGRSVRVNGESFQVIGVLKRQGTLFGLSLDNRVVAPIRSPLGRMLAPAGTVGEVLVRTSDDATLREAMVEVEAIMRVRNRLHPSQANNFEIETADATLAFWARISQILFIAFPGLVSIALVVGGMVIMNIMLVSVAERTREIGVRKAIGARRRDIVFQILVESGTLAGGGALIGIAAGVSFGLLVGAVSPLPAAVAPGWLVLAAGLGIGVGVLAGVYPAARAARMDPVVALRYE